MTLNQSHDDFVKAVNGYKLADLITLSEDLLNQNKIRLQTHYVDHEDMSVQVEFRIYLGLLCDYIDELDISREDAEMLMLEQATEQLINIGIPKKAQQDIRLKNTSIASWIEVDCVFFLEPKEAISIDPKIGKMVTFDWDFMCAQARLDDVLNAKLPDDYSSEPIANINDRVDSFACYLTTALPWHMQWLLEYSSKVNHLIEGDEVIFQYELADIDAFAFDADYNPCAAGLPIFNFRVLPAIPSTGTVMDVSRAAQVG